MRSLSRLCKVPLLAVVLALTVGGTASADVQSVSIDPTATLSPGRQAIVLTGSITCTAGDTWAISARVIQGQRSGFGSLFGQTCTGEPQDWSVVVVSNQGLFHRGRASAGMTVIFQGVGGFGQLQLDRFVTVK